MLIYPFLSFTDRNPCFPFPIIHSPVNSVLTYCVGAACCVLPVILMNGYSREPIHLAPLEPHFRHNSDPFSSTHFPHTPKALCCRSDNLAPCTDLVACWANRDKRGPTCWMNVCAPWGLSSRMALRSVSRYRFSSSVLMVVNRLVKTLLMFLSTLCSATSTPWREVWSRKVCRPRISGEEWFKYQ